MALFAASYLLHAHHIRVAPTLSDPHTLRLQPSALIGDDDIDRTLAALRELCEVLAHSDAPRLTQHLSQPTVDAALPTRLLRDDWRACGYDPDLPMHEEATKPRRVAWLCHLIDDTDLPRLDPAFAAMEASARGRLLDRLAPLANPTVMSRVEVRSSAGPVVQLLPIMLPITSAWIRRCLDAGDTTAAAAIVQKGVDVAQHLGCGLVSLGQYTSIVTRAGRRLRQDAVGLTTGNTYSLVLALQAIEDAVRARGIAPRDATIAIVGAAGNIGQTAAHVLASRYERVLLLGSQRPGSEARLGALADRLPNARVCADAASLRDAHVVLATASAVDQPLGAKHFAPSTVVCDLSIPAVVRSDLATTRPDLLLIKGGVARLPFEEDLNIVGFPLPIGQTYGCMAEAILLGFEGVTDRSYTGPVRPDGLAFMQDAARRHGLTLADYKDHCVLGTEHREVPHVAVA